jgi:hypothetical protein
LLRHDKYKIAFFLIHFFGNSQSEPENPEKKRIPVLMAVDIPGIPLYLKQGFYLPGITEPVHAFMHPDPELPGWPAIDIQAV